MGRGTPPRGPPKQSLPVRTSKVTQKHVLLPDEIQTRPLPYEEARRPPTNIEQQQQQEEVEARFRLAERMSKEERENEGHHRLTAYAVGERYKMKSLAAFSKREHGAWARQYDEAIYTVYHLPLLPGYSATTTLRSSAPIMSPGGGSIIDQYEEADELPQHAEIEHHNEQHYDDLSHSPPRIDHQGFINETVGDGRSGNGVSNIGDVSPSPDDVAVHADMKSASHKTQRQKRNWRRRLESINDTVAEIIHFDYGVSVFYNMTEAQENDILHDMVNAGVVVRPLQPENREIEQCHYGQDSNIPSSRIFNDFFTFKTNSHYLKLSLAHALAQSTKLSAFEELTLGVLDSASTIPKELAATGTLALDRRQAIQLTGKLFKLRVDVNLVSNVLDVPELFWSEAGLKALYDAGREYFEIGARVQTLNERLAVASDLLDIIHEHVNEQGMSRITIIIIWLIVIACLVAVGEVWIDKRHADKLTEHIGWRKINAACVAAWQCDDDAAFNRLSWSGGHPTSHHRRTKTRTKQQLYR
ncbi:DUF155-domain-containing protein [Wallemia mellicola CBS 633.66]|uniref:DUF155-domain-containing protein n=1 Tax=Wallemia mellicola (strain ATCC MYA-4683 / CBS 633.66) TaxID=671144 RepID=I4Y7C3_WALMC|nr:DUF155-domain-containing protein [Wallemia mellicola CBS 633.66]EIM19865.1 DUF155-domain-containing protein [Wallemia mellicola CBS 633.66]|eukprot:XP_006960007.1 DUF155-domain-containing protein [Wallemia mellicola CBS 633.66]